MKQLKIVQSITNREDHILNRFLLEIGKTELISALEEVDLAQRIKLGDQHALEKLVKANLRFVVSVAKQYQNQGLSLPDLINEGNIGLIRAAKKFDETKGFKFISYAVWWIRQTILTALAEQKNTIKIPSNQNINLKKINKTRDFLEQKLQRTPTNEEIMEILDMDWDRTKQVVGSSLSTVSLDQSNSHYTEDSSRLSDSISSDLFSAPDSQIESEYFKKEIARHLSIFSEDEIFVITHYFGIDVDREYSKDEIANKLGISKLKVKQIKDKVITRLKRNYKTQYLKNI